MFSAMFFVSGELSVTWEGGCWRKQAEVARHQTLVLRWQFSALVAPQKPHFNGGHPRSKSAVVSQHITVLLLSYPPKHEMISFSLSAD